MIYSDTDLFNGSGFAEKSRNDNNQPPLAFVREAKLNVTSIATLQHDRSLALEVNGDLHRLTRQCALEVWQPYTEEYFPKNDGVPHVSIYCWLNPDVNSNEWDVGDTVTLKLFEAHRDPKPPKPHTVNVVSSRGKVELQFISPLNNPWTSRQRLTGYKIERSTDGSSWSTIEDNIGVDFARKRNGSRAGSILGRDTNAERTQWRSKRVLRPDPGLSGRMYRKELQSSVRLLD